MRSVLAATAACAAVYSVATVALVWPATPLDDAFIAFRYAENLAAGHGLVFNPGERVEGYTSLSWVLLLALAKLAGLSPVLTSQVLGLLFGLGTFGLLAAAPFPRATRSWASAFLCVSLPILFHFANGLETAAMAFLLTALFCWRRPFALGVVAALLVWTRPEGVVAVLLWLLARRIREPRLGRADLALAGAAATAWLVQTGFRQAYYGEWIANSARAKLPPLGFGLRHGLPDLGAFLWQGGAAGWLPLLAVAGLAVAWRRRREEPAAEVAQLGLFTLLFFPVLAAGGGDSMKYWRFYVPLAPGLFVLAAEGLRRLATLLERRGAAGGRAGPARRAIGVVTALVLAGTLFAWLPEWRSHLARSKAVRERWADIGRALAGAYPPHTRLALCPVGIIPYTSGLVTVDMLGLTDAHVARASFDRRYSYPGHQRHDGAYVLDRKPDLILLANGPVAAELESGFPWQRLLPYERDIVEDERFRRDYALVHLPLGPSGQLVALFARREGAEPR